jgi:hypothetical protein
LTPKVVVAVAARAGLEARPDTIETRTTADNANFIELERVTGYLQVKVDML